MRVGATKLRSSTWRMFQLSRIASAFGAMRLAPASVERTKSGQPILAVRTFRADFKRTQEEQPLGFRLLTATQEEKNTTSTHKMPPVITSSTTPVLRVLRQCYAPITIEARFGFNEGLPGDTGRRWCIYTTRRPNIRVATCVPAMTRIKLPRGKELRN